ncbi:MAG: type VI secretion system baseplate subunit TssG [bacterium]|nr:type VI secretion system baseplate subunit TssG [bacterium]
MAAPNRQPTAALKLFEELATAAERFGFAGAMRLIECAFTDAPRLGESVRPSDDPVRLAQDPSLAFPTGPIEGFEPGGARARHGTLRVRHPGLFGPNGPLPSHLTEYVLGRVRHHDDFTLRDFADLFHHRLLSLYWRALATGKPIVQLDRPQSDRFGFWLGSLGGFAGESKRASEPRIDRARRHWSGHFARPVRNAEGLESVIAGFFGAAVRVEEFVGRWLEMPGGGVRLGQDHALGRDAFLGESLWDCSQSIRIVIGPLDLETYERLLPGGESWSCLRRLVDSYLGIELSWEARLVLRHDEVPGAALGGGRRLGWTSWLEPPPETRDVDDLTLLPGRPFREMIHANSNSNSSDEP